MKLTDFNLLKKFMNLSMSDNDHESLAALKRANAILKADGLDWIRVLDRSVQVDMGVEEAPDEPRSSPSAGARPAQSSRKGSDADKALVDQAFSDVFASDPSGSFMSFMSDLRAQWEDRGSLSPKQRDALFRAAERARDGGGRR